MGDHCLGAVDRGDGSDGNNGNVRSREANGLAVAEVENDVLGREVDAQADDAAPPKGNQVPSREPAEQPLVSHDHVGVARFCPVAILLHTDPERQTPEDRLP